MLSHLAPHIQANPAERSSPRQPTPTAQFGKAMLEIVPPPITYTASQRAGRAKDVSSAIKGIDCLDYINIPEIISASSNGEPIFNKHEASFFAELLSQLAGIESVVNKVVAISPMPEFKKWLISALAHNLRKIVLVGKSKDNIKYAGPPIPQANSFALEFAASRNSNDLAIGNIIIVPGREGEARRAALKKQSGASFFTTQIIFEPGSFNRFLLEYDAECRKLGLDVGTIFLSFATAKTQKNINFFKWLGCRIPEETERMLPDPTGKASIEIAHAALMSIKEFATTHRLAVSLGINAESISHENLSLALEMLGSLHPLIKEEC